MKNIFKFNRVFYVILLLSVVTNASAIRWFEDGAFAASADIINERFIAAKRAEAQAIFARVDAARAAEAAANIAAETALDAANANLMAGFGVSEGHIKAEAPVATQVSNMTVEVPVAAVDPKAAEKAYLAYVERAYSAYVERAPTLDPEAAERAYLAYLDECLNHPIFYPKFPKAPAVVEAPAVTVSRGKTPDQLNAILKTESARNAAAVSAPATFGSRLSEAGRVVKLHGQMALDKLTAQENRKTVYAVAGIAAACAVGYGIYKYFSAKSAAPKASSSGLR